MWSWRYHKQFCHLLYRKLHCFYTCYSHPCNNISWSIFVCFVHIRACSVQGFFWVVCSSNNCCITWRGRCPCPLVHSLSDKCSKLPEGIVPAGSFPETPAVLSSGLRGLSCWKEIGGFSLFFFFFCSVGKQFCSFKNELQTIPRYQMSL